MDTFKEIVRAIFYRYCIVFTLIVGVNLLWVCILGDLSESFSCTALLVIEAMALLCGLGDIIFFLPGELSKRKELVIRIVHYIYINMVVFGVILIKTRVSMVNAIVILISIAVIYWINVVSDFYKNEKDALKMNDLLEKINNNDE